MCTVSWVSCDACVSVVFNRDESRRRLPGLAPRVFGHDGGAYVAPLDPEGGGTWIAAGAGGLVVCILNHTPPAGAPCEPPRVVSRGGIVPPLVVLPHLDAVEAAVLALHPAPYRPFELVAMAEDGTALHAVWDGAVLRARRCRAPGMVSTSSQATAEVLEARRAAWEAAAVWRSGDPVAAQDAFHRGRDPARGAFSVNMARPDARTVSRTRVVLGLRSVVLRTVQVGEDGSDGEAGAVELPRVRA